jgi:Helix-turn-helix domain
MTTPQALANSPKTFLDRDNWMRAVLASDLPDAAVRVAIRIALHLRVNGGRCDPSYVTLAAESHVAERSVYRLVALLEHAGWIVIQRTRGRLSNQYILLNPAQLWQG